MMMEDSDAAVVEQVRAGDTEAFRVLVERHSHAVFRLAYRMTGNEQDAEDVVQETFLRAFRRLSQFVGQASFGVWLHRIAANCSLDLLRRRQRQADAGAQKNPLPAETLDWLPSSAPTPDCVVASAEMQQQVQSVLDALSPQERAAFVLRHFENRSIAEISLALGLRVSAAKHSVFRAVQKMRLALAPILNSTK
jgi:RNA polymerase sigma-70 factor (ECF subfamily)